MERRTGGINIRGPVDSQISIESSTEQPTESGSRPKVFEQNGTAYYQLPLTDADPNTIINTLLADDNLEEIMVLGTEKAVRVYHRHHGMCITNIKFTESDLEQIVSRCAPQAAEGMHVDADQSIAAASVVGGTSTTTAGRGDVGADVLIDGRLPDGSRLNITLPPASPDGITITIRKFPSDPLTFIDLINYKTMTPHLAAYLWTCVEGLGFKPANILIAGGTGSGKTSTLNALTIFIPKRERLITIEDTAEIVLKHDHWIRLEAVHNVSRGPAFGAGDRCSGVVSITMDDLVKNTLRMRPDRILIGEVRGSEAQTMFTAMNTGHEGTLGTLHANTANETITRLTNPPMDVPVIMMSGLDLIIMQSRLNIHGKSVRRITEVVEVGGIENQNVKLNPIFKWNPATDTIENTGVPSRMREKIATAAGITLVEFDNIVRVREGYVNQILESGVRDSENLSRILGNIEAQQEQRET